MNEKMRDLLFKFRKGLGELTVILTEIENTLLKEELSKSADKEFFDAWMDEYKSQGYSEREAREKARVKYIEAIVR